MGVSGTRRSLRGAVAAGIAGLAAILASAPGAFAAGAGWERVELPVSGSYALVFRPSSAPDSEPLPAIVFLHGAGSFPEHYPPFVEAAAEAAGAAVVVPKSLGRLGWGAAGDAAMIDEAIAAAADRLPLDPRKTAIAGYSAGGAYAYLLAYLGGRPFSAVFTLAAPYYEVPALADPERAPPLRMYYGTADPNYRAAYPRLIEQWRRLGVPFEEDVRLGFDHNDLPAEAVGAGFAFLVDHELPAAGGCVPSEITLCLGGGRFRVEVEWAVGDDAGSGRVVPVGSDDSGLFWFFDPANWEVLVKVLDACPVDGHRWVFAAATTNVAHVLRVTDTTTGEEKRYEHAGGTAAPAIVDTAAFECNQE